MGLSDLVQITGHDNLLAAIAATSSSEASGYEVERIQDRRLWYRTRTVTGTYTVVLTWDLGASVAIPFWCGLGHNLLDDATIRIEVSDESDFDPLIDDTGTIAAFDLSRARPVDVRPPAGWPILHVPASPWTARYLRVTLADPSRSSGHVELGHALTGPVVEVPSRRMPSLLRRGAGQVAALRRWVVPVMLSEAAADELAVVYEWSQTTGGRLLLIPRPDETDSWQYQVIWGRAPEDDDIELAWRPDAVKKLEIRIPIDEVSY